MSDGAVPTPASFRTLGAVRQNHGSCRCGSQRTVEVIIQARPSPSRRGTLRTRSRTLCEACAVEAFTAMELMLDNGSEPEHRSDGDEETTREWVEQLVGGPEAESIISALEYYERRVERLRDALQRAVLSARIFNRSGMTWLEYDAELVRLKGFEVAAATGHPADVEAARVAQVLVDGLPADVLAEASRAGAAAAAVSGDVGEGERAALAVVREWLFSGGLSGL